MTRNFAYTATSVASRLLVSTFLFILLARLWGPDDFGTFSFAFSVSALLMLTADFGFPTFLLREIAADTSRAPELIVGGVRAKLFLTVVMTCIALVVAAGMGPHNLPLTLFGLLSIAALLLSFVEFYITPLRAFGRYDLEAVLAAAGNALQFLFAGGAAWLGGSPVAVAGAMVISRAIFLAVSWWTLGRVVPFRRTPITTESVGSTLRILWPYGVDGALTSVWSFIDVIAVRMVFGTQIVGLYAGGQKILQGVVALAPVVGNVMIPHIARKAHDRATDTWRAAAAAGALMVGIGLIVAVPLIILPGSITHALFGSEFSRLAEWLPWFGLILFVRYSGAAFGIVLSAIGLQKKRVLGQVLAVVAYMAGMAVVRVCELSVTAALASMLTAMSIMGAVYAWHIFKAKRTNYLKIGPLNSSAKTVRQTAYPFRK